MSARYLLAANVVSDLVRHPQGRAATKIAKLGDDAAATSISVAAELRCGSADKRSARVLCELETLMRVMELMPLGAPPHMAYGDVRVALEAAAPRLGGTIC